MPKQSQIGLEGFGGWVFLYSFKHTSFRGCPKDAMVRKMNPPQKVHARGNGLDRNFVGMKRKMQTFAQKFFNGIDLLFQPRPICRQQSKIISIAGVVLCAQRVLHKLVKLIHVHIDQELGGEVAERKPNTWSGAVETPDNLFQQPERLAIRNICFENAQQHVLINAREELLDIHLQDPAGARVIPAHLPRKGSKRAQGLMGSFATLAGKGGDNELLLEEGIKHAVDRVVKNPVPDTRFMNAPRFRICNRKRLVWPVPIGEGGEIVMESDKVVQQTQ